MWPPEMELIDQLSGDAMPLAVAARIFEGESHARRVLAIYVDRGVIALLRGEVTLPEWEAMRLLRDDPDLLTRCDISVTLTDAGAESFESGRWDRIS